MAVKKETKSVKVDQPIKSEKSSQKETKKSVSENSTRVYHVVKRSDGKWEVKFAGGEKAIKLFTTQKEAVEYSTIMAENQEGALLVHNSKGKNKGRIKSK